VPWGERLGGAEAYLDTFLRSVDQARIDCDVIFLEDGAWPSELMSAGIRTSVVASGRLRQPLAVTRTIVALRRHIQRTRPAVMVNWIAKAQIYGGMAAAWSRRPAPRVVWWQHGVPQGHWMDRVATLIPANLVGCCSNAVAAAQGRMRPVRRREVVWPGIDPELPATDQAPTRQALGIEADARVVAIVGRLQPWKNQDQVIRAVARLRKTGSKVHLLVVGGDAHDLSPRYPAELRRLASEIGVASAVTFTGQVADARPYYRIMDVVVNASRPEPFGIVILEAMAAGVPVVAVDDGGPREILDNGAAGVLVASESERDLAAGIARLMDDDALRARLSEVGRRRIATVFSAARMTRQLEDLFISLANGRT
jgi:glycosyltransferase involved in cell wall biosynthesis